MDQLTLRLSVGVLGCVAFLCVAGLLFASPSTSEQTGQLGTIAGVALGGITTLIHLRRHPDKE